ncbi:MAG TPA: phosphate ABC transporter ATP-binding protein PstB [Armatimonadota bacterium]|nr:phosphate ABC transporter ATP-binding protein PstB [Armatimonadota bacterium]
MVEPSPIPTRPAILILPAEKTKFQIRGLGVTYADLAALHDVTINLPKQQITALIGPSGCGKSTFLRCLNRMNDLIPNARVTGEILLDDIPILAADVDPVELRKRVGMVFQRPNPFPMSIFDNVAYGPRRHGVRGRQNLEQIVEASLKQAALWEEVQDKLRQSAFDLSGGQQQRLCIARALAVQPEVLLMDEPSSALDPISTFKIEELMTDIKNEYTIVLVTHNMYQASRVADFTGFFLAGELIEFGPTVDIFERPVDRRTDGYVRGRFG